MAVAAMIALVDDDPVAGLEVGSGHDLFDDAARRIDARLPAAATTGDDFDHRSAAEVAGNSLTGMGFTDAGSSGSQFTDLALSISLCPRSDSSR